MSEQIREQISAFLDGELPDNETELLLKRMTRDGGLRECFGRYALVAELVRDPTSRPLSRDFAQRVNCVIDGEAGAGQPGIDVKVTASTRARNWWRPIAGAAVAAGVAAFAVVALERRAELTPGAAAPVLVAINAARAPAVAAQRKEAVSYTVPTVGLQAGGMPQSGIAENAAILPAARLTNYVFAHSKYSSALGQRNVLSGLIAEQPSDAQVFGDGGKDLPPASTALPAQR